MKNDTQNDILDLGAKGGTSNIEAKQHRQLLAAHTVIFIMSLAVIVLAASTFYFAIGRQPINHVVEIDDRNRVRYGGALDAKPLQIDRVVPNEIVSFIDNWRTVTGDNTIQKLYAERLYCMLARDSTANTRIDDYYKDNTNNPFELNRDISRTVSMRSILQQTAQTWFVEWTETTRNHNGDVLKNGELFKAQMVINQGDVRETCRERNSLGIYVTDINWSSVL